MLILTLTDTPRLSNPTPRPLSFQLAYSRIHSLESSEASLKSTVRRLDDRVLSLEDEKEALVHSLRILKMRLERLQGADKDEDNEEEEASGHPPPFGIVYAGTEREEDESFKALVKELCLKKEEEKGRCW